MGGETPEIDRRRLLRLASASVPVSDLEEARSFYTEVIGLEVMDEDKNSKRIELGHKDSECRIVLYVPNEKDRRQPGGFTGIVFYTESIYDFHKTMMDESVRFVRKPLRDEKGRLVARFSDLDGNEFDVVDHPK